MNSKGKPFFFSLLIKFCRSEFSKLTATNIFFQLKFYKNDQKFNKLNVVNDFFEMHLCLPQLWLQFLFVAILHLISIPVEL